MLLVMDCWLPESSCGLFKTSCCLEEALSVACPPSSADIPYSNTCEASVCWESVAGQPVGTESSALCWVLLRPSLSPHRHVRSPNQIWLWRRSCQLSFCLSCVPVRLHCQPREEMNGSLTCYDVCPDLMCHIQFGKPFAVEASHRGKKHFKKFQN